jgi:heterodisulfide reductase subunit B2
MSFVNAKIAIFPGCSLEGSSSGFEVSLQKVLGALGLGLETLKDWNCCGATSAHALNRKLYLGLSARNLTMAQDQGFNEVLAPCAACYHRMASVNFELQSDDALREEVNKETFLHYQGKLKVLNILELLSQRVGVEAIAARVKSPLAGLKVACYYGCLNPRIPRMESFDNREYPMSMDKVARALGAQTIDWGYKTECCGASMFISAESVSAKLVSKILKDAVASGADCIAVACPLCQNNLDTKQQEIREKFGIEKALPVLYITQLMGLAFGIDGAELELKQSFVPFQGVSSSQETGVRSQ